MTMQSLSLEVIIVKPLITLIVELVKLLRNAPDLHEVGEGDTHNHQLVYNLEKFGTHQHTFL